MSTKDKVSLQTKKDPHKIKESWVQKLLSERNSPFSFYQDLDRLLETPLTSEDLFWRPIRRFLIQSQ